MVCEFAPMSAAPSELGGLGCKEGPGLAPSLFYTSLCRVPVQNARRAWRIEAQWSVAELWVYRRKRIPKLPKGAA